MSLTAMHCPRTFRKQPCALFTVCQEKYEIHINQRVIHGLLFWLHSFSLPVGEFDPDMPEEGPSAPPPGWLDNVSGYEEVPSDGGWYRQHALCYMLTVISQGD